jgi:1-Cys peroxiredoxin 6
MTFSPRLGETIPNFTCATTHGVFGLHDFIKKDCERFPFTVLMSHPADYTPVCTTEMGKAESLSEEFTMRGVKLLGLSCDSLDSHKGWCNDILYRENKTWPNYLSFPIIADESREIATTLGMLDPRTAGSTTLALPARALFVLDKECKVRLAILYPASTGRNFDEILRVLDSLSITDSHSVATPVDWKKGQNVIVPPGVPSSRFKSVETVNLPSGKDYLRYTTL